MRKTVLVIILLLNIGFLYIGKTGSYLADTIAFSQTGFSVGEWGGEASPTPSPTPTPIPVTSPVGNE